MIATSSNLHPEEPYRMHAYYSALLASVFAQNAAVVSQQGMEVAFDNAAEYWLSSRSRIDLWEHALVRLRNAEREKEYVALQRWWERHGGLLEEIFVTEPLTRTVAASMGGVPISNREGKVAPVADSVFILHHDLTNEIRRAMLRHQLGAAQPFFMRLNRIRLAARKLTDQLLGWMSVMDSGYLAYVCCEETALGFRDELAQLPVRRLQVMMMQLSAQASCTALRKLLSTNCSLPQSNREVLNSAMNLIGRKAFDRRGLLRSDYVWSGILSMTNEDEKPSSLNFDFNFGSSLFWGVETPHSPGQHSPGQHSPDQHSSGRW